MGLDQLAGCPVFGARQPGDEVPAVLGDRGLVPFADRSDQPGPGREVVSDRRLIVLAGGGDYLAVRHSRADDIAAAEGRSTGLPVTQSREQTARAGEHFRLAAELITARAAANAPAAPGPAGYAVARPAGVAGLITPWRTPFLAQARALAPALAAGCTVVLKPDEWAPLPAALLAEITAAADLPDGVLNIVHGSRHRKAPGSQARDALIAHPSVARLSFAGDAVAGQ